MVLLIDTNIVLDVLLNRPGFVKDSSMIWKLCETEQAKGYISTLTYANMMYVMRKQLTPEQIEKFKEKYQSPEVFTLFNGELHVMKMPPEEAKEQKEKQKKDAQQKNPAKGKKKNRSGESR